MSEAGGSVDGIDPPRLGMRGNPHMLMMDRASGEIAALVQDRLAGQGPRRWRGRSY